ncbi:diphosphomevalonate decarboxylase [Weissella oryzae SG25]|uniref:diphosphomevalonate decarboxylase n=1 Tax=Weissella oryzae (strain DSM 25784 / JCM 18191 / LMG 30913 / SG25) TaxID=1329250 RepID=A0A069CRK1_WEIOS|nr:diphosphomevalonate decarboxylase [Weissella oryzae]GAK30385.1 diphosphomevalonate decarboxylase [Weissella oryzae SG25]
MSAYTARAHTNIALLKYWGKADQNLIIPTTSSVSLTLNEFYTDTTVEFLDNLAADEIYLDGAFLTQTSTKKVQHLLDLVRQMAGLTNSARVTSYNHVPTSAGLASSASAFAALAGAASKAAGLSLSPIELSRLARQGSGSASRSIYGGFAIWERGYDDLSSYARSINEEVSWPIQLLTVIINDQPKKINSSNGMQNVVATDPFYQSWVAHANIQVNPMLEAIERHDLAAIGAIAEANALQMHAQNMMASPAFTYLTDESWQIISLVQNLRKEGLIAYVTMDAGPNVKIISKPSDTTIITEAIQASLPTATITAATPGPGLYITKGLKIND